MKNYKFWLVILVMVFGIAFIGCDTGSGSSTTIYNADGRWLLSLDADTSAYVTITGAAWSFDPGGPIEDNGFYIRSGNTGVLNSAKYAQNIGTATLTSNTTITMIFVNHPVRNGTFYGIKQP